MRALHSVSKIMILSAFALAHALVSPAHADLLRWSSEVEDDPFDNKGKLTVTYMDTFKSGLLIFCEQGSGMITIRRASSFPYDQSSPPADITPMSLIVDKGQRHGGLARTMFLGTGNIGFDLVLPNESGKAFLSDMAAAKSKLYLKIGESDPEQFSVKGSTKAAEKAATYCYD